MLDPSQDPTVNMDTSSPSERYQSTFQDNPNERQEQSDHDDPRLVQTGIEGNLSIIPSFSGQDFDLAIDTYKFHPHISSETYPATIQPFPGSSSDFDWTSMSAIAYPDYPPVISSHSQSLDPHWHEAPTQFVPVSFHAPDPLMPATTSFEVQSPPLPTTSYNTDGMGSAAITFQSKAEEASPTENQYVPPIATQLAPSSSGKKISKTKHSTRSAPYTKKPTKQGTLVKSTTSIAFRACWRCKKYRKSCDDNAVCNSCVMTSGFRVWPSSLGCRRGNLEECVYLIIPAQSNDVLEQLNHEYTKPFSWRVAPKLFERRTLPSSENVPDDFYEKTIQLIQSTQIHGPGILELLRIAARYQRKQTKEDIGLRMAFASLYLVIQFYHTLVSTDEEEAFDRTREMGKTILEVRKALIRYTDRFLHSCLTGRLKSWPATFLAANVGVIAFVFLADSVAAIPETIRSQLWKDVREIVIGLRRSLYEMAQELLIALAKGADMLKMTCWNYVEDDKAPENGRKPNNHGIQLVDQDREAFDAMVELVDWRTEFFDLLNGDSWMANNPFAIDLLMIMSLSRLFSVSVKPQLAAEPVPSA